MKRCLNLLFMMALALSACYLCYSCDDKNEEIVNPEPGPGPEPDVPNPTPIPWEEDVVEGGDRGVGIKVTSKTHNNFVFECTPGKYVKSYKLDVYPLSRMYNYLVEAWKLNNDVNIEELIKDALYDSTGAGAYLFTKENLNEQWANKEFDWANTAYMQGQIVPDAEYLIITIGCNDEAGERPADMKICHLTTEKRDLIGSPEMDMDVATGYRGFAIQFKPNADCKYFYQYSVDAEQIDEYIKYYGQAMYEQFIRHTTIDAEKVAGKTEADLYYSVSLGTSANPDKAIAATAIALDENKTPGKYVREDFNIKKRDPDLAQAECSVEQIKAGASIVRFNATMGSNCSAMFYVTMTKAEWDADYANASKETLKALGEKLDAEGYGIENKNYGTGNSYTVQEEDFPLTPNTDYVIAFCGRNEQQDISDVKISTLFKTQPRTLVGGNSNAKAEVGITGPTRTSLTLNYHFNTETAVYYHQYILDQTLLAEGNEQALAEYLISTDSNVWPGKGSENTTWTWTGLLVGTEYTFAMMSEDWNGVCTPIAIAKESTEKIVAGPNPEMAINWLMDANDDWAVQFALVKDVAYFYHYMQEDTYSTSSKYTYEECVSVWKEACLGGTGMKSYNTTPFVAYEDAKTDKRSVAVCVPIGANEDGSEKIGDLYLLFYDKEKGVMKVDEVFPDAFPKSTETGKLGKAQVVKKDTRVIGKQLPKVAPAAGKVAAETEVNSQVKTIYLDMKSLAKPHSMYLLK